MGGSRLIDMTGQQVGMWTVLHRTEPRKKSPEARWLCVCVCGKTSSLSGHDLRRGRTSGCISCSMSRAMKLRRMAEDPGTLAARRMDMWQRRRARCAAKNRARRALEREAAIAAGVHRQPNVLIDMTGIQYGQWTVLARALSNREGAFWLCRCSCGTETAVRGVMLRTGRSSKCRACSIRQMTLASAQKRTANRLSDAAE